MSRATFCVRRRPGLRDASEASAAASTPANGSMHGSMRDPMSDSMSESTNGSAPVGADLRRRIGAFRRSATPERLSAGQPRRSTTPLRRHAVTLGFGRIVTLHDFPSASHQIHEEIRCLYF